MDLDHITSYLSHVATCELNEQTIQSVRESLAQLKVNAVKAGDQKFAREIWCYEEILDIQTNYLKAFNQMKNGAYYEGWCTLERVEIGINFLEKHFDITAENDKYKISFIKKHTERFQSLFPYKYFISPGVLHIEKKCSICNTILSLRNHCGHIPGEIYDGEICVREITKAKMLELSLVTEPVQKYSVMFLTNSKDGRQGDSYNYGLVEYVIRGLREPFHGWEAHRTKKRHPHSNFKNVGRNDKCPCESGMKYKSCCLRKEGVLRPHTDIIFEVAPPSDLPQIEYTY